MNLNEFRIGEDFWRGDHRWRCTDIGTRVIVAICLEPHEIVETDDMKECVASAGRRVVSDDPSWWTGPPYAVSEEVFDEDDLVACTKTRDEH